MKHEARTAVLLRSVLFVRDAMRAKGCEWMVRASLDAMRAKGCEWMVRASLFLLVFVFGTASCLCVK